MERLAPILIVPAVLLYIAGLTSLIMVVLARAGGWHALAKRYRVATMPDGQVFRMASATFGTFTNYNNVLRIELNEDGVGFSPFFLFRIAHPPIFLPWSAMTEVAPYKILWSTGTRFVVDGHRVRVYRAPGQAILDGWNRWQAAGRA